MTDTTDIKRTEAAQAIVDLYADKPWRFLILRGERGSGMTTAGALMTIEAARDPGVERIAIIAPSPRAIADVMVDGESGILACSPADFMPTWEPGYGQGGRLRWPSGVEALCFSAEKPDRLRGPQFGFAWGDELQHPEMPRVTSVVDPALRIGARPRCVLTTTAKDGGRLAAVSLVMSPCLLSRRHTMLPHIRRLVT